ncbi:Gmad2 immunoglobulin-like domain-containing protein [Paenibacillus psychroresistens]|nr:Gmad2 immunoglobulin-like domain-containing protein [Paenibacillus psychroresistens]
MKKFRGFAIGVLVGGILMTTLPSLAATMKYMLVKATYPIYVNNTQYNSPELPILNYEGNTYIPMKAIGELLGGAVQWNADLKRAEIYYGGVEPTENNAFRKIKASGTNGKYSVTGEGRVFEAVMSYAVTDGHTYLLEKNYMLNEGGPAWSAFTLDIQISKDKLPLNGTLSVELFEYSAKDGSKINIITVPLESFKP